MTNPPPASSVLCREDVHCIAFDAVGTLLEVEPSVADVYLETARRYGSRLSREEIARRFPRAYRAIEVEDFHPPAGEAGEEDWTQLDRLTTNEVRERERWRKLVSRVLDDVADAESCFEALFERFAQPSVWKCYPEVAETLGVLSARGYVLAVASNFDGRLHAVCDGLEALRPISVRVVSSEVGYRKPSLHFYHALARAADCRPNEVLMVGDDETGDVAGARQAGLEAVWLRRQAPPGDGWITSLSDLAAGGA